MSGTVSSLYDPATPIPRSRVELPDAVVKVMGFHARTEPASEPVVTFYIEPKVAFPRDLGFKYTMTATEAMALRRAIDDALDDPLTQC